MTYGQIKLRLTQAFPGVSLDLIEGWVNDRYQEILGELPWTRLTVQSTLTTVIGQSVYSLPSNCGLLRDDALANSWGTMTRFSNGELNDGDSARSQTGEPFSWASAMDDGSTPPNMQVQLYPVPDAVYVLPLEYMAESVPLGATSTILQVWIQPSALIEGATAKIKAHLKDYTGATFHSASAEAALKKMRKTDAQNMGPATWKLDPYYTSYRRNRYGGGQYPGTIATVVSPSAPPAQMSVDNETPSGAINGVNTVYTLANAPNPPTSLHITVDGLAFRPGTDYTLAGNVVTFATAPETGAVILATYKYGNASSGSGSGGSGSGGSGSGGSVVALPNFVDNEVPDGAMDGTNRTYTLANAPNPPTSLRLVLNAMQLRPGIDYTLTGNVLVCVAGQVPQPGDWMSASYRY